MINSQINSKSNQPIFSTMAGAFTGGVPASVINGGLRGRLILIRSVQLAPQLLALLALGVRKVELLMQVEGQMLVIVASIIRRGPKHPPYLHPLRESERVLSDLYLKKRAASDRRNASLPAIVMSMRPLIEQGIVNTTGGGP